MSVLRVLLADIATHATPVVREFLALAAVLLVFFSPCWGLMILAMIYGSPPLFFAIFPAAAAVFWIDSAWGRAKGQKSPAERLYNWVAGE